MSKEDSKWLYQQRKRFHLCVQCGEEDAYTLTGRARCYECTQKRNAQKRKNYDDTAKEKASFAYKKRRNDRIQNHQCTRCGRALRKDQTTRECDSCLAKHRIFAIKYSAKKGILPRCLLDGVTRCAKCGKEQVADGYKVCNNCLEKCRKSLEIARATPQKQNYFEKSIIDDFCGLLVGRSGISNDGGE